MRPKYTFNTTDICQPLLSIFFPLQSTFSRLDEYSDNKDHITTFILWLIFQKLRDTIAIVIDLRTYIVIETTMALLTVVVSAMTTKRQRETTMWTLQFFLCLCAFALPFLYCCAVFTTRSSFDLLGRVPSTIATCDIFTFTYFHRWRRCCCHHKHEFIEKGRSSSRCKEIITLTKRLRYHSSLNWLWVSKGTTHERRKQNGEGLKCACIWKISCWSGAASKFR